MQVEKTDYVAYLRRIQTCNYETDFVVLLRGHKERELKLLVFCSECRFNRSVGCFFEKLK